MRAFNKRIMCQLSLALIFSSLATQALAIPPAMPTAPLCNVDAKVISVSGNTAVMSVGNEDKIKQGYDRNRPCTFSRAKKVTVEIPANDAKTLKPGSHINADMQQTGVESEVQIKTNNIKPVK